MIDFHSKIRIIYLYINISKLAFRYNKKFAPFFPRAGLSILTPRAPFRRTGCFLLLR